jgi:hypothetical protein
MGNDYFWGFLVGLVTVFVIIAIISIVRKKRGKEARYDERQELARGKAYKHGFTALLIYCVAVGLTDLYIGGGWCDIYTAMIIGVFLSTAVFAVQCILTDAYFAVGERPTFWLVLTGIVSVINFVSMGFDISEGHRFVENGAVTHSVISPACGLTFLVLFAVTLAKTLKDRTAEQ